MLHITETKINLIMILAKQQNNGKKLSQSDLQRNFSGVNTVCMFNLKQYELWREKCETIKQNRYGKFECCGDCNESCFFMRFNVILYFCTIPFSKFKRSVLTKLTLLRCTGCH